MRSCHTHSASVFTFKACQKPWVLTSPGHTHTQRPALKTPNRYKRFGYYFCDFLGRLTAKPKEHELPNDFIIFTFGSPSDDAQPTSDGKREHPLLSSCRSAAFPHRIRLRDGEGEMLGSQAPLPKHDPRWHVHFLTRDEKTTTYVLLLTLSPSRRPCCLLLALVFTCPPPILENIQSSQVSLSKKCRKQVQAFLFF